MISIESPPEHYAKADWFCMLLRTRLKQETLLPIKIIYGIRKNEDNPVNNINLVIPKFLESRDEISRTFYKISANNWIKRSGKNFILDIDVIRFSIWMLNREEEYIQKHNASDWDHHGQFNIEKTLAYQNGFWQKPVVDIMFLQLIKRIEEELNINILNRTPWGNGKQMGVWITHDIDKLMSKYGLPLRILGWYVLALKELIRYNKKEVLRWVIKPKQYLYVKNDPNWESIIKILAEEQQVNAVSTFFIMSLRRGVSLREGVRYPIDHPITKKAIKLLKKAGCSIGLHPGYYKPFDKEYLILQKNNLEKIIEKETHLVRNHYLRFKYPDSWTIEERAGFKISSNVGWSSYNGFRSGTCWPYRPFDINNNRAFTIVEIPLIYMDNNAYATEQEIVEEIVKLAKEVSSVYGLLTINFHSDIWNEFEFPYKGKAFSEMLRMLHNGDWHFVNTKELMNIF